MAYFVGELSCSRVIAGDGRLKRFALIFCGAWTALYGLIVAASAIPEFDNNKALGGVSVLSGVFYLAVGTMGIVAAFSKKGEIQLIYLMFELLTAAGNFALAYAVIGQEVAYCRQIALFRSASLKFNMTQMGSLVEEQTVFLGNQTWFETKGDNWATRIGIYGNAVGDPLTDFAAERCQDFFMGAAAGTLSSIAAMIFVSLLKSALGGYCSLSLFVNGVEKNPYVVHENAMTRGPAIPATTDQL